MTNGELRRAIVAAARGMNARGINRGTSGNVSARAGGGMLITPSAVPYETMASGAVIEMTLDGIVRQPGANRPSHEWRLHAAIYGARADVGAIVHAHPVFATALACLRRDIPAFHYLVALAGGRTIRCSAYATVGTAELAAAAVEALEDRYACLLANHGLVACGATPDAALALAVEVEALASQYWHARQLGDPVLLDDAEMARVLDRLAGYREPGSVVPSGPPRRAPCD